jgi:hypothetical protein
MSRKPLLIAALITLAGPAVARAQQTIVPSSAIPAGCNYLTCGLRLESGFFGAHIVRGTNGERVGKSLGGFGRGVDILRAGPDSASFHARKYSSSISTATTLQLLSVLAYLGAMTQAESSYEDSTAPLLLVTGLGFSLASIPFTLRAQRDLSRSVWWYNSALPR